MPLLCRNARVKWDALLNPHRSAICSTVASVEPVSYTHLSLSPLHPSSPSSLILAYLNTHFQEDISLSSLSEQFHLTPSHIIHIFKPLYELSPIQYLNHRRIGEAQYLLETTKHSAGAIAGMVGIYNRNYFYSTFKKMVGMSPSDYRRICAF